MNFHPGKFAIAGAFIVALFGGMLSATVPANATHYFGHAILSGIMSGVIANSIINGDRRQQPVYGRRVYGQQVYTQPVRTCYWRDIVEHDRWGQPINSRIRECR